MLKQVDITVIIRELLFGHDCVIIPGFGGFIGNYTPARIEKNSGTFYPPVKQISFNRNLNHNDGLLVGKISGSSEINYGDARDMVEAFVGDIRRKLNKGEKVILDRIGSFVNNQEGNVQFEPDINVNYHLDSYGLESFQCLPLEGYDVRNRILRHTGKDPVKHSQMRKVLWRAAIIIPVLSLLLVVPLKLDLFKAKIETVSMNPLVSAELEHNKNVVQVNDESANIEEITVPVIPEPTPQAVADPLVTGSNIYYLVTGSFKSEKNAVFQLNMLEAEGFSAEIIPAPNGFYRVSAMICNDLETALMRKDSISKQFPDTWISKRR